MTKYLTTAVAAGALAFGVSQTSAAQLSGTSIINFGPLSDLTIDGATFNGATGVNFTPGPGAPVDPSNAFVVSRSGDFSAYVTPFSSATFSDFDFGVAVPNLWVLAGGNFAFDLTSAVNASVDNTFLNIQGTGVIRPLGAAAAAGLEDTAGNFSLTASRSDDNQILFSFQSTTSPVPRPPVSTPDGGATAMLLGLGLLGMGAIAKRR